MSKTIETLKDKTWYHCTIDDNWADEMDIKGTLIATGLELKDWKQSVIDYFKENTEATYSVGTNEDITHTSADSVLSCISVGKIVSDTELKVLMKFNMANTGFLELWDLFEY